MRKFVEFEGQIVCANIGFNHKDEKPRVLISEGDGVTDAYLFNVHPVAVDLPLLGKEEWSKETSATVYEGSYRWRMIGGGYDRSEVHTSTVRIIEDADYLAYKEWVQSAPAGEMRA